MKEILKWINTYIELQSSCFLNPKSLVHYKEVRCSNVEKTLRENNLIEKIDFGIVLIFTNCKFIVTSGNDVLTGFERDAKIVDKIEIQKTCDLRYVIFLCDKDVLCRWSQEVNSLVKVIRDCGADAVLLNKPVVLEGEIFHNYSILPVDYINSEVQFAAFNKYRSSKALGFHTKDSDFLFKTAFNHFCFQNWRDSTLVHYFERVYHHFVYGYIVLPGNRSKKTIRSQIIFNFWFKDLYSIQGCEAGVSHIEHSEFGECRKFYFLLACNDKQNTVIGLQSLQSKYDITILEYDKKPTDFVIKFMHYESEVAYFNTYFIGIFNRDNWLLFVDVFRKISETVGRYMACADYALHTKDVLSVEEKYHLRFGYFIYPPNYSYTVADEYRINNILPWFAVPDWSITLQKRERIANVNILDL